MKSKAFVWLIAALPLLPIYGQAGSGTGQGKNKKTVAATTTAAPAQVGKQIPCPGQAELVKIPELVSSNGRLRATVSVGSELERIGFRYPLVDTQGNSTQPGAPPPAFTACFEQWVRAFRSPDANPPYPARKEGGYLDPMAGPTLRAQLGDVIELAFYNVIDPANFGNSIDRGDEGACDETSNAAGKIYPKADKYPDCFHGSTTANIHYHGTHTNPNTTGDNVFLEILSFKRLKDEQPPAPGSLRSAVFDAFFNKCEQELLKAPHVEYPRSWNDLPQLWTAEQKRLIAKFDATQPAGRKLWPTNERQLRQGAWPQYYIGAYPYCFRLPEFVEPTSSSAAAVNTSTSAPSTPHTHGAGTAELGGETDFNEGATSKALIMGQAPGTHWYHAHKHGSTTIDVSNGMTGVLIIEGSSYDNAISTYYDPQGSKNNPVGWTRKQPVMVINQLGVSPNLMTGGPGTGQDKGPDFSVNGRMNPLLTIQPGEVKMLRIVNTSSRAGAYFIGPPAGFHWKQIAQDGVQFNQTNWEDPKNMDQPFLLMAGNRADLLVSAPAACTASSTTTCKFPVQVYNIVDLEDLPSTPTSAPPPYKLSLFTFNVKGTAIQPPMKILGTTAGEAPKQPSFLSDIGDNEIIATKEIGFATNKGVHTIDGHQFDGEVGKVVLLNTAEEWKVTNATANPNISHPFHIHINPFQVTEIFNPNATLADGTPAYVTTMPAGGTLPAGQCYLNPDDEKTWKPCQPQPRTAASSIWWDVFPIPSGLPATKKDGSATIIPGYFKMRSRFVDYAGYYVIHCHILAHEDRGMMTVVEVAPIVSPYSHH